MIFQLRKLLLLSPLLFLVHTSFAQDDLGYCDLPATQDIIFTSVGTNHLGFYWTPVPNASAYDVLIIDLNTNITAHQSIEYSTEFFVEEIEVTECTFVSITSRCLNNVLGGTSGANPGTCSLIFDDLVLQSTMDDGSTINLMCGDLIPDKSTPSWNGANGPGAIGFDLNNSSIVMSEISGIDNNTSAQAFSIMMLGVSNGNAYSKFPSSTNLSNQMVNTSAFMVNLIEADITSSNNAFYSISVDQNMSTKAYLDFESSYNHNVLMETRYCLQGKRKSFKEHEAEHGGIAGLQSNGHSTSVDFLADSAYKTTGFSTQEFSMGPNPTSGILTINVPTMGIIRILDINGRVLYTTIAQSTQIELDTANWPAGTYITHFEGKGAPIVQRFIKF